MYSIYGDGEALALITRISVHGTCIEKVHL